MAFNIFGVFVLWPTLALTALAVGGLLGGGWLAYRNRTSLTKQHLATGLVLLLGVSVLFVSAFTYHGANQNSYSVGECGGHKTPPSDVSIVPYNSLSSDSQQIFKRALASPGEYRSVRQPADLRYISDVSSPRYFNYINYNGTCYYMIAQGGSLGIGGFVFLPVVFVGLVFTTVGLSEITVQQPDDSMALVAGVLTMFLIGGGERLLGSNPLTSVANAFTLVLIGVAAGGLTLFLLRRAD